MLYNCLAYVIDQDPSPTLLVMPTDILGLFVSKNRIQPMVEACERLREKKPDDEDDYTNLEMKFQGMIFSIAGANSAPRYPPARSVISSGMRSINIRVRRKETDPMSLSKERTKISGIEKSLMSLHPRPIPETSPENSKPLMPFMTTTFLVPIVASSKF